MTQNLVPAAVATTKEAQEELLENVGQCTGEKESAPKTPITVDAHTGPRTVMTK